MEETTKDKKALNLECESQTREQPAPLQESLQASTTATKVTMVEDKAAATTATLTAAADESSLSPPPPRHSSSSNSSRAATTPFSWTWQSLQEYWADAAGVNEIAVLKDNVNQAAQHVDDQNRAVQEARTHMQQATAYAEQMSSRHKQMMLLHREQPLELSNDDSVQQFAQLTAAESKARVTARQSLQALSEAESALQQSQLIYMNALRKRYHEEQVWQDKWRVLGTYWTWLLIGLNSVVFVAGQVLHWRREESRLQAIHSLLVHDLPQRILPELHQQQQHLNHQQQQELEKESTIQQQQVQRVVEESTRLDEPNLPDKIEIGMVDTTNTTSQLTTDTKLSSGVVVQQGVDGNDMSNNDNSNSRNDKNNNNNNKISKTKPKQLGWADGVKAFPRDIQTWWNKAIVIPLRGQQPQASSSTATTTATTTTTSDQREDGNDKKGSNALVAAAAGFIHAKVTQVYQQTRIVMEQVHWPSMTLGVVATLVTSNLVLPLIFPSSSSSRGGSQR